VFLFEYELIVMDTTTGVKLNRYLFSGIKKGSYMPPFLFYRII
jgi:hypothetical protein